MKNVEQSKVNNFSLTSFRESAQQTADGICILRKKKKKNYAISGMGIRSSRAEQSWWTKELT